MLNYLYLLMKKNAAICIFFIWILTSLNNYALAVTLENISKKHECFHENSAQIPFQIDDTSNLVTITFDISKMNFQTFAEGQQTQCAIKAILLKNQSDQLIPLQASLIMESRGSATIGSRYLNFAADRYVSRTHNHFKLTAFEQQETVTAGPKIRKSVCNSANELTMASSVIINFPQKDAIKNSMFNLFLEWKFEKIPCSRSVNAYSGSLIGEWKITASEDNKLLPTESLLVIHEKSAGWLEPQSRTYGWLQALQFEENFKSLRGSYYFQSHRRGRIFFKLDPDGNTLKGSYEIGRRHRLGKFQAIRVFPMESL